ncbi:MAG: polyprenyl synthetase family protein, partial [Planctomycetota bacterium]
SVQDVHRRTVVGQQFDLDGRADPDFNLNLYEQAVQAKTGRYLALGMVGSAIVAGLDESSVELLWQVGDQLGPAFQIQDDLLDMTRSKGRGGELGNDIREGKPSILYAHALESGGLSSADRNELVSVLGKDRSQTSDEEVAWVIDLFQRCGSIDFAHDQARNRAEKGVRLFRQITGVPEIVSEQFENIARYAVERDR